MQLASISVDPPKTVQTSCLQQDLLTLALRGSTVAFAELIQPHERLVYLASLAMALNTEMAEKIALEAIYRAFIDLKRLSTLEKLGLWLTERVISVGRELVGFLEDNSDQNWEPSDTTIPQTAQMDARDHATRKTLTTALLALPQPQRIVIVLRDSLHYTVAEIAQILGISPKRVKETLSRARFGIYRLIATAESETQQSAASFI